MIALISLLLLIGLQASSPVDAKNVPSYTEDTVPNILSAYPPTTPVLFLNGALLIRIKINREIAQ
uniref:U12-Sparatoxin-Hju1a_1 n=1 Tax=Heteropoda jugulans TaxID=1358901 RepID=A0A4Q8KA79_9ARAC